jgi:hypothetical protein
MADLPEGWEFLAEQSDSEWEVPERFRGEGKPPLVRLLIEIVQSDLSGNDVVEGCGKLLASYARFNQWLAGGGQRVLSFEGVTRASSSISILSAEVFNAWTAYSEVRGADPRRRAGDVERSMLVSALGCASAGIARLESPG